MKINIRANYYYEENNEEKEIILRIQGNYNLSVDFIAQFEAIKEKRNQFFYFDYWYGIEFDIDKSDIYQLSDLTIEEMEFIRTLYSLFDYYNVYDESGIQIQYMKLDCITFDAEF